MRDGEKKAGGKMRLALAVAAVGGLVWDASAASGQVEDLTKGKAIYQKYCVSCHGSKGEGDGAAGEILMPKPRDHTKPSMKNLSDEYLTEIISKGGTAVGKSPMMPAAKTLSEEDIALLVTYIRSLAK